MLKKIFKIIIAVLLSVVVALTVAFFIVDILKINSIKHHISSDFQSEAIETIVSTEEVSSEAPPEIGLVITSPTSTYVRVTEPKIVFTGTSDAIYPVFVNGVEILRDESGGFTYDSALAIGNNVFNFVHKDKTYTYKVNYRYVVINYFTPEKAISVDGNTLLPVIITARKGSVATASFNGNSIELLPQAVDTGEEFINYSGSFKLPEGGLTAVSLGKIVFSATQNGVTESFSSGNITLKKSSLILDSNPSATPTGGRYIDVGSGKITEIISYEAETFDPYSTDDKSRPTNSYLPKGTVDYSDSEYVYYKSKKETKEYTVLRYGKQVYTKRENIPTNEVIPVVKEYIGTLPDHNEIGIASFQNSGRHTTLTLDTMWKAPFYFELLQQSFINPNNQDYNYYSATFSYVDITFCYATVLTGELVIPEDNPIFSSAEIIKNQSDYTLRLHLKKTGEFYGWDANYNSQGQLVFEFLNPAKVTLAENEYGVDLSGVKVLIDVGHGGKDPGALGLGSARNYTEAFCNLQLAFKLKTELVGLGADVYMTRETDVTSSNDQKIKMLKSLKPDYCISIHHNALENKNSIKSGFSAHFSQTFSKKAAELVFKHNVNSALYKSNDFKWHYYYMARSSYCPVVLTENGYMTNSYDYNNAISPEYNVGKAKAIAKGIAEYFLSIQ